MATERNAPPLAAFFKFTKVGQKIVGLVKSYRTNDNGAVITIAPAGIVHARGGTMELFASASVGLSTDLNLKISPRDAGKYLSIEFVDTEPTKKESKKKIFRVMELSREELIHAVDGATRDNRNEPYTAANNIDEGEGITQTTADDDDELPF